ncbi:hypothetical protein [Chroococcidiopsis sp. TS-821]|uniref:hypothetical protein n=1 Tax=Chroococcidiopsis sp. TS-821 TaxID=1378066 RepID=UPI000CEEBC52|nr:hypothetical protein [Chroococcidiopsis sp. TS-821]PPS41922.1 hypothetical protein B1A85_15690 [Chroococcidiopsis sp. TS-821]
MKIIVELPVFDSLLPTEQTEILRRIESNIKAIAAEMNQPCRIAGWMSTKTLNWKFYLAEDE